MTVANNQPVSAEVCNEAYMSKTQKNIVVSVIELKNPTSGSDVEVQKDINSLKDLSAANELAIDELSSELETLSGGYVSNSVTVVDTSNIVLTAKGAQHFNIDGSGGPVTLSATPFGSDNTNFIDGQTIRLLCVSDTNTVNIENQDIQFGAILNGKWEAKKGSIIELVYNVTLERFVEINRNF